MGLQQDDDDPDTLELDMLNEDDEDEEELLDEDDEDEEELLDEELPGPPPPGLLPELFEPEPPISLLDDDDDEEIDPDELGFKRSHSLPISGICGDWSHTGFVSPNNLGSAHCLYGWSFLVTTQLCVPETGSCVRWILSDIGHGSI